MRGRRVLEPSTQRANRGLAWIVAGESSSQARCMPAKELLILPSRSSVAVEENSKQRSKNFYSEEKHSFVGDLAHRIKSGRMSP